MKTGSLRTRVIPTTLVLLAVVLAAGALHRRPNLPAVRRSLYGCLADLLTAQARGDPVLALT